MRRLTSGRPVSLNLQHHFSKWRGEPAQPRATAQGYVLAGDCGGSNLRVAVVNRNNGEIVAKVIVPHERYRGDLEKKSPGAVIDAARTALQHAILLAQSQLKGIPGLALADFAYLGWSQAGDPVDLPLSGQDSRPVPHFDSNNLKWSEVPIGRLLEEELGIPVLAVNDLHAASIAAAELGPNVVVFTVGTGLGGGSVIDGVAGGYSIGRTPTQDPATGTTKPLREFVGGAVIAEMVGRFLRAAAPHETSLQEVKGEEPHAGHVEKAYQQGDPYAKALWRRAGRALGEQLFLRTQEMPAGPIAYGGGVLFRCPGLRAEIQRGFAEASWAGLGGTLEDHLSMAKALFRPIPHGVNAELVGAARAASRDLAGTLLPGGWRGYTGRPSP